MSKLLDQLQDIQRRAHVCPYCKGDGLEAVYRRIDYSTVRVRTGKPCVACKDGKVPAADVDMLCCIVKAAIPVAELDTRARSIKPVPLKPYEFREAMDVLKSTLASLEGEIVFDPQQYMFIPFSEFKQRTKDNDFSNGPWIDSFGDGYGEPYNPNRAVWGTLFDGSKVRSRIGMETENE